jgi:muramidase (phage lysozyme)
MANLVPLSKSSLIKPKTSGIVKADKLLTSKSSAIVKFSGKTSEALAGGALVQIEKKIIQVDKLLKDSLLLSKKEGEKKRVGEEQKDFESREKELEKNKPKPIPGIKLPSLPKMGFLDWIKNFITQTILGFFAVRLIEHLPKLLKLLPVVLKVGEFLINIGGKLLDGLMTFIDWGYKAIDGTRQFIKNIGGESWAQNFDKFVGAVDNVLTVAMVAALATADSGGGGGDSGGLMDLLDIKKGAQAAKAAKGASAVGKAASGAAKLGTGAVVGIVAGAGLLASALGEGAFQLRKVATKPLQDKKAEFDKLKWFDPKKYLVGAQLAGMNMLLGPISALGVLLDVVGAPFRYAIELLRFPFLSEEDKKKQAYNLAKFDARIREDFRKALNLVTLGFAFKEKGSFGNIYGNKGAQKEMMGKMAGGGRPATRGGKFVGGPTRRTLKKKKKPRTLSFTPRKIKPGANTGGEAKVQSVFPNPEKAWWDPLGVFTGKQQQTQQKPQKPKGKTANPQQFLVGSNDVLGRAKYFIGPTATLVLKTVLGQQPDDLDYKNIAKGLNSFVQTTFGGETLGFAGGGEVDTRQYFSGEDYTDVIAKTIKESVTKEVDTTIRNLSKELALRPVGKEEENQQPPSPDIEETGTSGGGTADTSMNSYRRAFLDTLAYAEGTGNYPNTGYNTMFTGKQFSGYKDHPRKIQRSGRYASDAAGRYQFLSTTWDGLGLPDFSPANQDKGALKLLAPHVLQAIDKGDFATAFHGARKTWASLPGAGYGQPEKKMKTLVGYANARLEKYKKGEIGKPITSIPDLNIPSTSQAKSLSRGSITSYFGSKESFRKKGHEGVDIGLNQGTPLSFKMGGRVINSFKTSSGDREAGGGYGSYMDVKLDNGNILRLAHLSKIFPGSQFKAGSVVALSGGQPGAPGSGRSGGPHLHLEQHSARLGTDETLKGKLDPVKYGGFGLVQTGGIVPRFHGGPILKTGNFFGHKGEFVIDKDSVDLFGVDFIDSINRVENQSQLIAKAPSIIEKLKAISGIAGYTEDDMPTQTVYVYLPSSPEVLPVPVGSGGGVFIGGGVNNTVPGMEALNAIG